MGLNYPDRWVCKCCVSTQHLQISKTRIVDHCDSPFGVHQEVRRAKLLETGWRLHKVLLFQGFNLNHQIIQLINKRSCHFCSSFYIVLETVTLLLGLSHSIFSQRKDFWFSLSIKCLPWKPYVSRIPNLLTIKIWHGPFKSSPRHLLFSQGLTTASEWSYRDDFMLEHLGLENLWENNLWKA